MQQKEKENFLEEAAELVSGIELTESEEAEVFKRILPFFNNINDVDFLMALEQLGDDTHESMTYDELFDIIMSTMDADKLMQIMGLFQKDIAKILGVDVNTITNWERGRYEPCKGCLGRIEGFLGG